MRNNPSTALLLLTLLLASLAIVTTPTLGQSQQFSAPALDWKKTFSNQEATWVGQVSSGEYAFFIPGADQRSYRNFFEYATLIKIDSSGNTLWTKNFSSPFPEKIIATNGGYLYTTSNNSRLTINKLDSNGNSQWNQTLPNIIDGSALLIQTTDGGYAITIQNHAGYDNGMGNSALLIIKTGAQGITQWTKTLTALDSSYSFRSLIQTSDGGYALAGSFKEAPGLNGTDFCLAKIDLEGNLQWTKTYGGANDDDANSLVQTNDDGYVLVGNTLSFGAGESDALMVKTDTSGNLLWAQTYGGFGSATTEEYDIFTETTLHFPLNSTGALNDYANCIIQTNDGGLAFAGTTEYDSLGYYLVWLVKTDSNGVQEWNQTYPSNTPFQETYGLDAFIQARDGSFVLAGYSAGTDWHRLGNQVSLIIKTQPAEALPTVSSQPSPMPYLAFQPLTIHEDGIITPSTAPITHDGNEYKLTDDIHNPIIVKADNIIVNGQGHLLNGNGTIGNLFVLLSQTGVDVSGIKNVTIHDLNIQNFKVGILLDSSNSVTALQNTLIRNNHGISGIKSADAMVAENNFSGRYQEGVHLTSCLNSGVIGNTLTDGGVTIDNSNGNVVSNNDFNGGGIGLISCKNTLISGNIFYKSWVGTDISDSSDVTVAANSYSNCNIAISAGGVPGTLFYMNNFIDSTYPSDMNRGASDDAGKLIYTKEVWDNGAVGNYWSNYTRQYPNAQQVGNSGTWNTPYVISENNIDFHPLVAPVSRETALTLSQTLISAHIPSPASSITDLTTANFDLNSIIVASLITVAIVMLLIVATLIRRKRQKSKLARSGPGGLRGLE